MQMFLRMGTDNALHLLDVRNTVSNQLLRGATIESTLVLSGTSTQVSGQTWPTSLTLINSESAHYVSTLVDSLMLTESEYYQAETVIDNGAGEKATLKLPVQAIWEEG